MWTNLFKKSVTLNCYTSSKNVHDLFKINHAKNFLPDWWKSVPKGFRYGDSFFDSPTIKSCPGFIDLYKKGIMIPLWSDLQIKSDTDSYKYQFADGQSSIDYNHPDAMGSYTHELQAHSIKILSPWIIECSDDVDWMFVNPIWNTASMEFTVLPGTLRFKYPLQSNINIMVRKGLSSNIMIGAGTPIAHLIPLSERNINLKCHLISDTEMIKRKLDADPFFFGSYKKVVELKEKQQKKCPFHH